jgi:hypothetical protein
VTERFFLDRSLGGKTIARLMRDEGWDVVTMQEHYGRPAERLDDVTWIMEMTERGFVLFASDHRILRNPLEQRAIEACRARVFVLPLGSLTGAEMVDRFTRHKALIESKCLNQGPAGYVVYPTYVSRVFP